jgi:hypothetical protein
MTSVRWLRSFSLLILIILLAALTSGAVSAKSKLGSPLATVTIQPAISAGAMHTCALEANGTVVCWGDNYYGQSTPTALTGDVVYTQVSAGQTNTCALRSDGAIACWGDNFNNQSTVPGSNDNFTQVSAGGFHSCGLTIDKTLVCWGALNEVPIDFHQVSDTPAGSDFTQVSAGYEHTCALKVGGSIVCWGNNGSGQAPALVNDAVYTQVTTGEMHTCGLKNDGTIACWGDPNEGQLNVPALPSGKTYVQLSAGYRHTCAALNDESIACWGATLTNRGQTASPTPNTGFQQVSGGQYHTCAMTTDAAFFCWGAATVLGDVVNLGQVPPPVTLSPTSLTSPVNFYAPVNQSFTASGGTQVTPSFSYDIYSGSLPSGLALIGGTLNGRPTQAGTFNFTLRALDGNRYMGVQALALTVNKSDSTTTLISSANPSVYGDGATVTATVSPSPDAPVTPTGSLTFTVDGVARAPVTLSGGTATLSLTSLPVGTRVISASYAGDSNFNASASSDLSQVIHKASTTTSVAALPTPSSYGESVVFTATIAPEFSAPSGIGGTVTFSVDGTAQSPVAVSGGMASLTVSSFNAGPHIVSASFSGDGNFTPSASADFSQTVAKASTAISLTSSATHTKVKQAVTFTVTVTSTAGIPTGSITLAVGGQDRQPLALDSSGKAVFTITDLPTGSNAITAAYAGDGNFSSSNTALDAPVMVNAMIYLPLAVR